MEENTENTVYFNPENKTEYKDIITKVKGKKTKEEEIQPEEVKQVNFKTKEDLNEYVICENCNVRMKKKTFKYSHKNTCKGNISEQQQPIQQQQPRKPNKLELQKEKYRDIFYKKHFSK
jgi:rubredoxin